MAGERQLNVEKTNETDDDDDNNIMYNVHASDDCVTSGYGKINTF